MGLFFVVATTPPAFGHLPYQGRKFLPPDRGAVREASGGCSQSKENPRKWVFF